MSDYHINHKLEETRQELEAEFSYPKVMVKTLHSYPAMKELALIDVLAQAQLATVTISPHKLTVLDSIKNIAHTFTSSKPDTLRLVETLGFDPLLWSFQMARHANNNPVDECYAWDWESFSSAADGQLHHWEKNLRDCLSEAHEEFAPVKASCEEVIHVAPSLPDVRALERKWAHPEHDLFSWVPVDDYFIWDKGYLQALIAIRIIAEAAGIQSVNPPEA